MIDTLQYIVAKVSLETSTKFWFNYIIICFAVIITIQGGIFKDD